MKQSRIFSIYAGSLLIPSVLALTVAACAGEADSYSLLQIGDQVPAYGARSLDGDSVEFNQFRGKPLLVNLWATWCGPCRVEMPEIQELYERYGDRVRVVEVSLDSRGSEAQVRRFIEDIGVTFSILLDPDERVVRQFKTIGVPATFLIDAEGTLRHRWWGQYRPLSGVNPRGWTVGVGWIDRLRVSGCIHTFEFLRRPVAEGGVQASSIVYLLKEVGESVG